MPQYDIRIRGIIGSRLEEWFDGMEIRGLAEGQTLISGYLEDQAALYGILNKIQNLGLILVEIKTISGENRTANLSERDKQED